ncbi:MAG: O-antigen ligase family protein [Pirellulaceae bacterium]
MDFALFILVNCALFLRPQDLVSGLETVPLYNVLIVVNLLVAAPAIVHQLKRGIGRSPATVCVIGILVALVLSLVVRADLDKAWEWGLEFLKVVAYFLLITAVLTNAQRFGWYLTTVVVLTLALSALATASFHGQLYLPAITHPRQTNLDAATGDLTSSYRLAAFGVFADPNDLSMIVVLSMLICLGAIFYRKLGTARFAIVVPLLFLGYVLALTESRGGLIALIVGMAAFFFNRFGVSRAGAAFAGVVVLLLMVYGGRQADIAGGISGGTGSQRTDLWYSGLQMMKWHPILGIGHGRFVQEEGLVAHSSYVQALAEWGLVGGTLFIGLIYIVLVSVWRLKSVRKQIDSPMLRNFQPYLMGALAAYAASMLTLTRCDVVPTYLVAGLGVSFERLACRGTTVQPLKLTPRLLAQMAGVSLGFILLLYIYIRFVYRLF